MHLRFENPLALWGLLGLAFLLALMIGRGLKLPASFSFRRFALAMLAFLCCVLGLSRPQWGSRVTATRSRQSNLFVAVDISRSMLAQDVSPSRLMFAITYTRKLLEQLPGVKVAIFPFALDGYLLIPLTGDTNAAGDMLSTLNPAMMTAQGTDLSLTLERLLRRILKMEMAVKEKGEEWAATQVLLLSDGETHVALREDIVKQYRTQHIPIFTVGLGTTSGATIPLEPRNPWQAKENLKDREGRTVVSKMHPEILRKIAGLSGGEYFAGHFEDVPRAAARIRQAMQIGRLTATFKLEKEYYPQLFTLALIFFVVEFAFGRWELAVRSLLVPLLLPLLFGAAGARAESETPVPLTPAQSYNRGVQLIGKDPQKAAEFFQEAAQGARDPSLRKRALFNLGNTFLRMGDPTQALQSYQGAFDSHASDRNFETEANKRISENIVLAAKMEEQMKQQAQQGQGDSQDEQPNQGQDPKGPTKNYRAQQFNDEQKERIFDLISNEEQQILQRLQEEKNRNHAEKMVEKTW